MQYKKIPVLICGLALSMLASCGGGENSAPSASATPSASPAPSETPVAACIEITSIAGKSESDVAAVLGEPSMSEPSSFADGAISNTYTDGTEVLFADGLAVRITVYPPDGSPMEDGAALLGLSTEQSGTPSYDGAGDYRWNDNTEYYSIDAFNNGDNTISYIYVITDEAYK